MPVLRVNVFGGPSTGKSTFAAWLFARLKEEHRPVEHVNEWIKTWAWEKRKPASYDQVYICAKQLRREDILVRAGVPIVTDSPMPLQLAYVEKYNPRFYLGVSELIRQFEKDYPSCAIWLERTVPYQKEGRYESAEEAEAMDAIVCRGMEMFTHPERVTTCNPQDVKSKEQVLVFVKRMLWWG